MSELVVFTLFSGSKGNCTYIKSGDSEMLIDLGVSLRAVSRALCAIGTSMDMISDIFITHDHSDHTRGLESACSKHNLRVHITEGSAKAIIKEEITPCLSKKTVIHPLLYTETVGNITVSSFQTPHDSKASVGFLVRARGHTLGFATDIGHISESVKKNLTGADLVILEANHDTELLKEGSYPYFLKERILSKYGHLSNESAAEFAAYLAENGTKSFVLAHLSEENNIPEMAFTAVYAALGNIKSRGISLAVAEPSRPTRLIIPEE